MGVQGVAEPGQVQVQAADGGEASFPVDERPGIGSQFPDRIFAIVIRVAPEIRPFPSGPDKIGSERIVVIGPRNLLDNDSTVLSAAVSFEQASFLRIVAWDDGNACPVHQGIALDDTPGGAEQGIGVQKALLQAPGMILHGRFHILQRIHDQVDMGREFHPGDPLLLFCEQVPGMEVLRDTDTDQQQRSAEDDDQVVPASFPVESPDSVEEWKHTIRRQRNGRNPGS